MKRIFKTTWGLLRTTPAWSALAMLAVAMLVWFAGPLLAVDGNQFWESLTSRLLTLFGLCLIWAVFIASVSWHRGQSACVAEDEKREAREQQLAAASQARAGMRACFKGLSHALKGGKRYAWQSRVRSADLPRYLLIGPSGSGKTSLLERSGLRFPLRSKHTDPGADPDDPGRCDWYITDSGVLLDTRGRHLERGDTPYRAGFDTLLELLRSRRRARPLNGILLALPANLLLEGSADEVVALGHRLRESLQGIQQQLRMNVPVYLLLTHADRVPGFDAFFGQLFAEENEAVFGNTFDTEQGGDATILRPAFEALLARLNGQVISRMQLERDCHQRSLVLHFPLRMGQLADNLEAFVEAAFSANRYQAATHLRGFYFTSAPPGADRSARFIHDVLARVIFPEAGLGELDKRERRRLVWRGRAIMAGAPACMGLFGLMWAGSFLANDAGLELVRGWAEQYPQQSTAPANHDGAMEVLASLDTRYSATLVFPASADAAYGQRAGLFQGATVNPVLLGAYHRELSEHLLPRVASALAAQVRADMGNRERLLHSLRAYLMLNLAKRREPETLKRWAAQDWAERYPGEADAQARLNAHLERLLQLPFVYSLDEALVAQARRALQGESVAIVAYQALRERAAHLPGYHLGQRLGSHGTLFAGTGYTIAGLYTRHGYQQYFAVQAASVMREVIRDNWVLGQGDTATPATWRQQMEALQQLYFGDYMAHWSEALNQLGLATFADSKQGARQLARLTSADSPLLRLLVEVRDNTHFPSLVEPPIAPAMAGDIEAVPEQARNALAQVLPETARASLERRFEPLHRMLDGTDGPGADLKPVLQALDDLQLELAGLARASDPGEAAFDLAKSRMTGQRDALHQLRNAALRLPRPLSAWFETLADDAWMLVLSDTHQFIDRQYQTRLYSFYVAAIRDRYPFHAHADSDVALNDFRAFFKPDGIADQFFQAYLQPFMIGNTGGYRMRSIDGRGLPVSRALLEQMTHVQAIQRGFFANGPDQPEVSFKLEPYTMDPGVRRAEFRFGAQRTSYRHGPVVPSAFKWPAEMEHDGASLVLESMTGDAVGIRKETGPWSLFRLFDLMEVEPHSRRDVLMLKANVGGMRATYLVAGQRSPNPFDPTAMRALRMPAVL